MRTTTRKTMTMTMIRTRKTMTMTTTMMTTRLKIATCGAALA